MLNIGKESHFSQTLQRDKNYFFLVFISLMVIFPGLLIQLLNLMQKKIADKSKYKVISVLYIFLKK